MGCAPQLSDGDLNEAIGEGTRVYARRRPTSALCNFINHRSHIDHTRLTGPSVASNATSAAAPYEWVENRAMT